MCKPTRVCTKEFDVLQSFSFPPSHRLVLPYAGGSARSRSLRNGFFHPSPVEVAQFSFQPRYLEHGGVRFPLDRQHSQILEIIAISSILPLSIAKNSLSSW